MPKRKTFTLLEIVVSLIIIAIGLTAVGVTFIGGKFILKEAENKSRAISIATVKMEEYLSKTFSGLGGIETPTLTYIGTDSGKEGDIPVDWKVDISTQWEVNKKLSISVPYKVIEVNTFYNEESPNNQKIRKNVKLINIIPYPYMHIQSLHIESGSGGQAVPPTYFDDISGLKIEFNYPVFKDIMVVYDVAIYIENSTNITPTDTIYTGCYLDNEKNNRGTQTRTPISMQPFISNAISIDNVSPGPHSLSIKWMKDTQVRNAGTIKLKEANLIIISTEKQ